MGDREERTCKNPPCGCKIADEDDGYCSVNCASTANTTQIDCDCGHDHCSGDF